MKRKQSSTYRTVASHPNKIAYIMSRFPHLPEVFILREINEISRQGWEVALYPLMLQKQKIVHQEAETWLTKARRLPFMSWNVLKANLRALFKKTGLYASLWSIIIRENLSSPNLLIRAVALLPKAVYAAELMEAENITHIHAHYATHPALVAWIIHRLTNISYSITVHAHDIFVRTAMIGTKMRSANFIIAISEFNREYLIRELGDWIQHKIFTVHCGILLDRYVRKPKCWQYGNCFELITIGSLQPYKGQRYLIDACALLRKRSIPFRCRVIGGGPEQTDLEHRIAANQLETYVELLGAKTQDEVAALLKTAHCYVQPSIITPSGKMEGIPVALMEAMGTGLPVIATAISGIPELVREGETGYLVPAANDKELADAIERIYHDSDEAMRRAANGRKLVSDEFELRANVRKLSDLFKQQVH